MWVSEMTTTSTELSGIWVLLPLLPMPPSTHTQLRRGLLTAWSWWMVDGGWQVVRWRVAVGGWLLAGGGL